MDNIINRIKSDLEYVYFDNYIYFMTEDDRDIYDETKKLLKEDYGFYDIVIDFDDFEIVNDILKTIPENHGHELLSMQIVENYLNYKIIKESKISYPDISVDEIEKDLLNKKYDSLISMPHVSYLKIDNIIKEKSKDYKKGYARIIFLLDKVDNIYLQRYINDLYIYKTNISMISYTTKELVSYHTNEGHFLEKNENYGSIYSKNKIIEMKERRNWYDKYKRR